MQTVTPIGGTCANTSVSGQIDRKNYSRFNNRIIQNAQGPTSVARLSYNKIFDDV